MAGYINYARVNAQRTATRSTGKSSAVTTVKKSFSNIPWAEAYSIYKTAGDEWEELATLAQRAEEDSAYEASIQKLETRVSEGESGAYEGNIRDENPQTNRKPLAHRAYGRRKAGQKALIENFINAYNLGDWSETIMPEIITKVGGMHLTRNSNGLISGKRFIYDNFTTDADKGLWAFLMLDSRSCYLSTQYKGSSKPYSTLVPLILYAVRLVRGEAYTAWDPAELRSVVNHELAEAMLFTTDQWPTRDELIEGREQGLTIGSGKDMGKKRSPISTFKLYATSGTCYQGMPACLQVMLAQIWVAHPDNRTKYMVLDPTNWDRVPPPLIEAEPLAPKTPYTGSYESDLPWEN